MTLAIPKEIHSIIKKHPEIKWTEVARQAVKKKANLIEAEKDSFKAYAYKRWAEEGEDAEKLFDF